MMKFPGFVFVHVIIKEGGCKKTIDSAKQTGSVIIVERTQSEKEVQLLQKKLYKVKR